MTKTDFMKKSIPHLTFFLFSLVGISVKTMSNFDLAQSGIAILYTLMPLLMLAFGLTLSIYQRAISILMLQIFGAWLLTMYLPKLIDFLQLNNI
ncbi:hypothetical protein OKZ62_001785 [Vibrio navarrensis]|nr:hypothetical protein [Vibrio navarrensis]